MVCSQQHNHELQSEISKSFLPVSSDVPHEYNAGTHVEVEGRGSKAAVELPNYYRSAIIVADAQWQRETEQKVGSCQVFQEDLQAARCLLLSLTTVELYDETIER